MTFYDFMREMNTLFIFFYFVIKSLPVFMGLCGCLFDYVIKRLEEKDED